MTPPKSRSKSRRKALLRVGLAQYAIHDDVSKSWKQILIILKKLVSQKAELIVLPEMWLGGPVNRDESTRWIEIYQKYFFDLRQLSQAHGVALYFSQLEKSGSRYFNTAYWIDSRGGIQGCYRKIHLFSFGGECRVYSSGRAPGIFETPWGKVGGMICYDLRFPELARALANQGARILLVCAQWPSSRRDHWMTLLKARAIENQIFVIGVNRLGTKGSLHFGGDSAVFDPWGNPLKCLKSGASAVVSLDLSLIDSIRSRYPFFSERTRLPFLYLKPNILKGRDSS